MGTTKRVGPIVKWAGGKGRLLPEIMKRLPAQISTYIEPFVGGGAVFFALANEPVRRYESAILCDANKELIDCYIAVRDDVEGVIKKLRTYRHSKRAFYRARSADTRRMTEASRAARFLFLNRTCFNGLYRVNASGKFNVPFGRYKKPVICDVDNLRAASRALAGVVLLHGDFARAMRSVRGDFVRAQRGQHDFVYCDPPYVPLSKTSDFTSYTKGGFSLDDHKRLAAWAREVRKRGAGILLSNADTRSVRSLYRGEFRCVRVRAPRSINCKSAGRASIYELLITARPGVRVTPALLRVRRAA